MAKVSSLSGGSSHPRSRMGPAPRGTLRAPQAVPPDIPTVALVATSRNDDHGGDLRGRMQRFVDSLDEQCRRHSLRAELILVEWNPPDDRPPLRDALRWPSSGGWLSVRILTVPRDVHLGLAHSTALPLFQMIAKNVGIRRARADAIVATNIDILLSDRVMRLLGERLQPGALYRADRHDVFPHPPETLRGADVETWCVHHTVRVNRRDGTLIVAEHRFLKIHETFRGVMLAFFVTRSGSAIARLLMAPVSAARGVARVWRRLRIAVVGGIRSASELRSSSRRERRAPSVSEPWQRALFQLRQAPEALLGILAAAVSTAHRKLSVAAIRAGAAAAVRQGDRLSRRWARAWLGLVRLLPFWWKTLRQAWIDTHLLPHLHTNGCGDFTLLARRDWDRLRGYPEWEIFSWHLDSVLLHQARAMGLRMVDFRPDAAVFHLEHSKGSGFTPEGEGLLFGRLDAMGIPYLKSEDFSRIALNMKGLEALSAELVFNDDAWGMADRDLPEEMVSCAAWENVPSVSSYPAWG